jgi:rod shape-determining protein MreC
VALAPRNTDDGIGALRLMALLALAGLLMALDHRGGWLADVRVQAQRVVEPLWWLASLPGRAIGAMGEGAQTNAALREDNQRLRQALLVADARLARSAAIAQENARLRELLDGTRGYQLSVQLAAVLDIDLDPFRQRVVLDLGADDGVAVGRALIDAGGVVGQVIEVMPRRSVALLVTDPDHAVPVQVVRSGLRLVAFGTGSGLRLPNIPQSGDIQVGDVLVTSGLGGRFPAGFPVGTVTAFGPDESNTFGLAMAAPAARLDRSGEMLLVTATPLAEALDDGPLPPLPPLPPAPAPDEAPDEAPAAPPADAEARP